MADYVRYDNEGKIINKYVSVDGSDLTGNILKVDRATIEAITKYYLVDNGAVREMTQDEKDIIDLAEENAIIQAESDRIASLDDKIDNLPTMTLTRVDNAIDNIGNLNDAKIFLKKLCRFIIKFTASN